MSSFLISVFDPAMHSTAHFDCGNNDLNNFILKNAHNYAKIGASKTYVLAEKNEVIGYYSISASAVEPKKVDIRWPGHPMPVVLLGRLAIDLDSRGKGYGRILVADAFKKTLEVSKLLGCIGMITDAKDENAVIFYQKCAFKSFVDNPRKMHVSMKTIVELFE